jgi:hypothetical protein
MELVVSIVEYHAIEIRGIRWKYHVPSIYLSGIYSLDVKNRKCNGYLASSCAEIIK